jgi:hypothetical protein
VIDRRQEDPGPQEREELERLLDTIDTALYFLDEAGAPAEGEMEPRPTAPQSFRYPGGAQT